MKLEERFFSKVDRSSSCHTWTARIDPVSGYGRFLYNGKNTNAHRVSYILAYGDIPDGLFVLHKCDNRKCVNPAHMFLGRDADNALDKVKKGRQFRKLDSLQVKVIRAALAHGYSQQKIARYFKVSRSHVSGIKAGTKRTMYESA